MAFDVTPTSGAGPYTFTADFANRLGFDNGLYLLQLYTQVQSGACPNPSTVGENNSIGAAALLSTGEYVLTSVVVAAGTCRTYTLVIRNAVTNAIIQQQAVNINNV